MSKEVSMDKLYKYFKDHERIRFRDYELEEKLTEIFEDPNDIRYCKKNLPRLLEEMETKGMVNLHVQNGEKSYFVLPRAILARGFFNVNPKKNFEYFVDIFIGYNGMTFEGKQGRYFHGEYDSRGFLCEIPWAFFDSAIKTKIRQIHSVTLKTKDGVSYNISPYNQKWKISKSTSYTLLELINKFRIQNEEKTEDGEDHICDICCEQTEPNRNVCMKCGTMNNPIDPIKQYLEKKLLGEIIEGTEEEREPPSPNPEGFPYVYDKEVFEAMTRYFVPAELTGLFKKVPINDTILSSFLATGDCKESTKTYFKTWTWTTHVLLTRFGIAYKDHFKEENFYFWNEVRVIPVMGKRSGYAMHLSLKKYVGSEELSAASELQRIDPQLTEPLRDNFTPFCKMLKKNFKGLLKEMKKPFGNIKALKAMLEQKGFDKFIDDCRILKRAGFSKTALKIAQDTENLIGEDNLKKLLFFQSECYNFKSYYSNAIWIYDKILELYPNDSNALKFRKWAQNKLKK